jgi:type III pantothenate kinase
MNLVLDFGNTRIKAGLFDGSSLEEMHVFTSIIDLQHALQTFTGIDRCLIASVTKNHQEIFEICESRFSTMLFRHDTPLPIKNLYKSALTLGSDRIAASVGSFSRYPGRPVLTIDAGTCIKYNFVNAANEYLGGAISPGISMRLRAMHHYTQSLPLEKINNSYDILTGGTTQESLLSGAMIGAACEADEMISRYFHLYPALVVVLSGGDGEYLSRQLKNRFFAHQNILLEGLNTILNYQFEK